MVEQSLVFRASAARTHLVLPVLSAMILAISLAGCGERAGAVASGRAPSAERLLQEICALLAHVRRLAAARVASGQRVPYGALQPNPLWYPA